jgi:predicted NodU family carbamoyl transferase
MAGGEWKNYYQMLKNFQEKTGFNVVICKLDE